MRIETISAIIHRYRRDRASRKKALAVAALAGLSILIIPGLLWERAARKDLSALTARHREFTLLAGEYRSLRENVNAIERKRTLTKTSTMAQAIGDIAQSVGIAGKVKSIKGTGTRTVAQRMSEEAAEVQIEKINMNEMIQLMVKIENAPMILTVKSATIKKSFENQQLLDITLAVSLFTGGAGS